MDALRFHWVRNLDLNRIEVNRFTRLVFGLSQSPFIPESNYKSVFPELTENIRSNMYPEDLVSGGIILSEVEVIKQKSIDLFAKGGFRITK